LWQTLPLVPAGPGGSPYSSCSSLAGNELLLDLEDLVREGLLTPDDARGPEANPDAVDAVVVNGFKRGALHKAARKLAEDPRHPLHEERYKFREHNPWVDDYALFVAIKRHANGAPYWDWEPELRDRHEAALHDAREQL